MRVDKSNARGNPDLEDMTICYHKLLKIPFNNHIILCNYEK